MATLQSLSRTALLLTAVAGIIAVCGPLEAASQVPEISARIDQMTGPTGKRPNVPASSLTPVPEDFSKLRLEPGFLLEMSIFDVPQMSASLRVDEMGNVTVPLVGAVHVAGKSPTEAQSDIALALVAHEILKAPQVSINVLQYVQQNINVLGEVQTPGRIPFLGEKSLAELLASVGGETQAAGRDIEIRHRSGATVHIAYSPGGGTEQLESTMIQAGDSVYVHKAGVIYVLGAVNRPGGYLMVNRGTLNLLQAVSLAYGTTQVASLSAVRIIRPGAGGEYKEIPAAYGEMEKGKVPPLELDNDDIVYVPTSTAKSILISGSGLISTALSATIYRVP